jgi:hypothetical protein
LRGTTAAEARRIGDAMLKRALAEHTYAQRAAEVEKILHAARADRHPSALGPAVFETAERRA